MALKDNVKIARNMMISAKREHELKRKAGGSNIGEYSQVDPECIKRQVYNKYHELKRG